MDGSGRVWVAKAGDVRQMTAGTREQPSGRESSEGKEARASKQVKVGGEGKA